MSYSSLPEVVFQFTFQLPFAADISLSCQVPGLLVTCSSDDSIKFWDIQVCNVLS